MATWYLIRYIHDTFICKECYFPEGQYQVNKIFGYVCCLDYQISILIGHTKAFWKYTISTLNLSFCQKSQFEYLKTLFYYHGDCQQWIIKHDVKCDSDIVSITMNWVKWSCERAIMKVFEPNHIEIKSRYNKVFFFVCHESSISKEF